MPTKSGDGEAKKTTTKATKKTVKKAKAATKPAAKKTATKKTASPARTETAKVAQSTAKAAPKAAEAAPKAAKKARKRPSAKAVKVRVRQVRSGIGHRRDFRQTLRALGIKHHQDEIVVTRNSAIDGMLNKVRHLIRVTPEE